jgi:aryl-alcohol dehydrogenase-like predicted oxidoreductase
MKYGLIDGITRPISRVVLGTSGMRSYEQAAPLLDAFCELGGTCLDCAYVYGGGSCETVIGEWLRRRDASAQVVLLGKGAHPPDCRPEHVARQLAISLERLGVERVDLYLLHRDDPAIPVGEWIDALEQQVRQGLASRYGISNWSAVRIREAGAYAARGGLDGIAAVSNHLSLAASAEPLYPGCEIVAEADLAWLGRQQLALSRGPARPAASSAIPTPACSTRTCAAAGTPRPTGSGASGPLSWPGRSACRRPTWPWRTCWSSHSRRFR